MKYSDLARGNDNPSLHDAEAFFAPFVIEALNVTERLQKYTAFS